jgi:hypothetical protein
VAALERSGFVVIRIVGSHYQLFNEATRRHTTVPHHNRARRNARHPLHLAEHTCTHGHGAAPETWRFRHKTATVVRLSG